jgi:transglutaminase-like putative cysteine protease
MRIEINYKIKYEYTDPVFLESNEIRIFPRADLTQRILDYNVEIEPTPSRQAFSIDEEDNCVLKTWFNELTDRLQVNFKCKVETLRENPYDFIIDFDKTKLPVKYDSNSLLRYLITEEKSNLVEQFSNDVKEQADGDLLRFLSALAAGINSDFKYEIREKGAPKSAEQTLIDKKGACRDFAVLFMEACKYQGLAARFVSGYVLSDKEKMSSHLHAWAEVYVPGGGWRGYDPVGGLAVADSHIAIAASHSPSSVIPVIGTYRSNVGKSKMKYSIKVKKIDQI